MKTGKQMKKLGRTSLKKNYVIFVAACLIAAFLGAEFTGTLSFSTAENYEQTERGKRCKCGKRSGYGSRVHG